MKKLGVILLVFVFVSCQNEADPEADKSFFTKFYDSNAFNIEFIPLDAAQTSDGGYLVLALKRAMDVEGDDVALPTIYLMKTDQFGAFVNQTDLAETLNSPAPSLLNVGGKFYFFCMENGEIQLIEVTEQAQVASQVAVGGAYPLAAGVDGSSLLLLNFDVNARQTVMSVVSPAGQRQASKGFGIGAADGGNYAPENNILRHVNRTGPQLPFFVGKTTGGQYYFNGIYNYTLSVLFTDLNNDNPSGEIQGQNADGGVSAMHSLAGGKFALARFNFGDNYILPPATITTSGRTGATDIGGHAFPELTSNAPVKIVTAKVNGADRVFIGSNTRGKQIALYGYNPTDGTLVGTRYLGFSNSFEIASMKPTTDDGLLVLGTTYIAGRFPRIAVFKLSAEALGKSFQ